MLNRTLLKLRTSIHIKTLLREEKKQAKDWDKIFETHISEKELQYSEYIKNYYKQVSKRHIIQLKNARGGVN